MTNTEAASPKFHDNPPGARRAALIESAATMAVGVELGKLATDLADVSRKALDEVNVDLEGTELSTKWPLVDPDRSMLILNSRVESRLKGIELNQDNPFSVDFWQNDKYHDRLLVASYGKYRPRISFVRDLIGWTGKMSLLGCPMVVHADLLDVERTAVTTFDDTELVRSYWQKSVDDYAHFTAGSATEENDGLAPTIWASPYVVLCADESDLELFSSHDGSTPSTALIVSRLETTGNLG